MENQLLFVNKEQTEFYSVLRKRVNSYFKQKGISHYANAFMVFKIIFFLSGLIGAYAVLIWANLSWPLSLLMWVIVGFFTAFTGVNVCHDAIHGAVSRNKTVNTMLGYLLNVVGANAYLWNISHNLQHHAYTNISGYDGDLDSVPIVRLHPRMKLLKISRFQHIYTFIFYGFSTLIWVFYKDYRGFFKTQFGKGIRKKHPIRELLIMILFKIIYYSLFLLLPLVLIDLAWWQILLGFGLMHFVEGVTLTIIIQLSHLVERSEFPSPDEEGKMENAWAVHQMKVTADYARNSWLVRFFFGGLNFHIEHHLFQRICHIHHKPISKIVQQTALEYGIPYREFPTLGAALLSHQRFLKRMGRRDLEAAH